MRDLVYGDDCSDFDEMSSIPREEDSDSEIRKSNDTCDLGHKWNFLKADYIFYF